MMMLKNLRELFLSPVDNYKKKVIIFIVALAFIFMPQLYPIDWDLNTIGFWEDIPHTYDNNPNFVYPPWGLILMLPYQWMQAEGSRILSVIVIGALVIHEKWSLSKFFLIVLSPYFLVTMSKSAMDILILVFPILLWEKASNSKWKALAWGIAIALSLLKPQTSIFVWVYFFWKYRREWKSILLSFIIVALLLIPISMVGSPPLLLQWVDNLMHPSEQNQFYWSINNISLTTEFKWWASGFILASATVIGTLLRFKRMIWSRNHSIAALLSLSMFLMPYTSQQSLSPALAFIPSWISFVFQYILFIFSNFSGEYLAHLQLWIFLMVVISLIAFRPHKKHDESTLA